METETKATFADAVIEETVLVPVKGGNLVVDLEDASNALVSFEEWPVTAAVTVRGHVRLVLGLAGDWETRPSWGDVQRAKGGAGAPPGAAAKAREACVAAVVAVATPEALERARVRACLRDLKRCADKRTELARDVDMVAAREAALLAAIELRATCRELEHGNSEVRPCERHAGHLGECRRRWQPEHFEGRSTVTQWSTYGGGKHSYDPARPVGPWGSVVWDRMAVGPCPCACNSGGFCGGCGHAGCGGRR